MNNTQLVIAVLSSPIWLGISTLLVYVFSQKHNFLKTLASLFAVFTIQATTISLLMLIIGLGSETGLISFWDAITSNQTLLFLAIVNVLTVLFTIRSHVQNEIPPSIIQVIGAWFSFFILVALTWFIISAIRQLVEMFLDFVRDSIILPLTSKG